MVTVLGATTTTASILHKQRVMSSSENSQQAAMAKHLESRLLATISSFIKHQKDDQQPSGV